MPCTIFCCSEIANPQWRWVEAHFERSKVCFEFARCAHDPEFFGECTLCMMFSPERKGPIVAMRVSGRVVWGGFKTELGRDSA
jgi:hypothetical protein